MKLFYRKLGAGKPLFILHGLFGLSDNWATVGKALSENFEVFLIDLRNHGNSPHSGEWTYPAMAQDVMELADEVKAPLILMGHSLGGKVAMQFTAQYPDKLEKLIVVDMAPKDYPGSNFDFIEKLLSIDLSKLGSRKEATEKIRAIVKNEPTVQLLLKNIQWNEKEKLDWKFNLKVIAENQNRIGDSFLLRKEPVPVPSLFIRGEKSDYILERDLPLIRTYFPDSAIKTIPGAGHWVHADKPVEFTETIRQFAG